MRWTTNISSARLKSSLIVYHKAMEIQARQGHAYSWRGEKVIALATGQRVEVRTIDDQWWGRKFTADALDLEPLPMVYFHNEVPA